jgi:hypothetical protein
MAVKELKHCPSCNSSRILQTTAWSKCQRCGYLHKKTGNACFIDYTKVNFDPNQSTLNS